MKKKIVIWMFTLGLIVIMAGSSWAQEWSIKADYSESCCCSPACPCPFGSPPTLGFCKGNALIEIKEGYFGDVRLDGMSVVVAFNFGQWVKLYISESATDEQIEVVVELMKLEPTFGIIFSGDTKILSIEKVPVSIEKTNTNVKFSVPDSKVEIEMMKGRDENPIKIQNLPIPFLSNNYTQYKSITVSHHSEDKEFSYSGTHGATSQIDASSKK